MAANSLRLPQRGCPLQQLPSQPAPAAPGNQPPTAPRKPPMCPQGAVQQMAVTQPRAIAQPPRQSQGAQRTSPTKNSRQMAGAGGCSWGSGPRSVCPFTAPCSREPRLETRVTPFLHQPTVHHKLLLKDGYQVLFELHPLIK